MPKDAALSVRLPNRLKAELKKIARTEGRTVSQVCEALLSGGLDAYKHEGSKYLQRFLSRESEDSSR